MHQGTGALDECPAARFAANRDRKLELEARRENTDVAGNHAHAAGNEGSNVAGEGKDRMMRFAVDVGVQQAGGMFFLT